MPPLRHAEAYEQDRPGHRPEMTLGSRNTSLVSSLGMTSKSGPGRSGGICVLTRRVSFIVVGRCAEVMSDCIQKFYSASDSYRNFAKFAKKTTIMYTILRSLEVNSLNDLRAFCAFYARHQLMRLKLYAMPAQRYAASTRGCGAFGVFSWMASDGMGEYSLFGARFLLWRHD